MEISVNGNRLMVDERSPLWSLVVKDPDQDCLELFGETVVAQQARHEGQMDSNGVQFVYEFTLEESRLINKLRLNPAEFNIFSQILTIVQSQSLIWQGMCQNNTLPGQQHEFLSQLEAQ